MSRAAIIWVLLIGCKQDPERPEIELVLGLGGEAPQGFRCVGPGGPLMSVTTLCDGPTCHFALMIDVVDMGPPDADAPSCRPIEVRAWCNDPARDCATIDTARVCRDVEFRTSDGVSQCARLLDGIANIPQPLVANHTPDRLVQVRAVALRGRCATYGYDPASTTPAAIIKTPRELYQLDEILGCAQSCPVVLDHWRGPLTLDLEVGDDQCTQETIRKCALGELDPIPPRTCGD